MTARRKPVRQRDIVSFGRRTPRFDLVSLRQEAHESGKLAFLSMPSESKGKGVPRSFEELVLHEHPLQLN